MSAKDIVTSLRKIAADPEHRGMLVNEENCLPSLVQFLLGEDSEVSFIALEVTILFIVPYLFDLNSNIFIR